MTTTKETIGNISIITITNPNQEFLRYIFDGDSKTLTITGDSLNVIVTDISSFVNRRLLQSLQRCRLYRQSNSYK